MLSLGLSRFTEVLLHRENLSPPSGPSLILALSDVGKVWTTEIHIPDPRIVLQKFQWDYPREGDEIAGFKRGEKKRARCGEKGEGIAHKKMNQNIAVQKWFPSPLAKFA